jgi:hypothetical protein
MESNHTQNHWQETYKSLITISLEGFKFISIANGGAAVALLAYLGNIASNGTTVPDMRWSMAAYLAGLFFCGLALFSSYLTQFFLLQEIGSKDNINYSHRWPLWLAFILLFMSLILFSIGSWQAVANFPRS